MKKNGTDRPKDAWLKYDETGLGKIEVFCEGYKRFITNCKTERECAEAIVATAEKKGFRNLMTCESLKSGDRVYYQMMGKAVALFVIGSKPLSEGMNILVRRCQEISVGYPSHGNSRSCREKGRNDGPDCNR